MRSIAVDAHLFQALGIQPEQGRLFSNEEITRWTGTLPPPIAILSDERAVVRQTRKHRRSSVSQCER
jgi:hypothetical protein